MRQWLGCIACSKEYATEVIRYECSCGGLLGLERDGDLPDREIFDERRGSRDVIDQSGVWRFREAVLDLTSDLIVTHPEGGTHLYEREGVFFKHEGENPSGSFKDRGMTVAITQARLLGARAVACASTGNTSASLAAYAAQAGMQAVVFVPAAKVSTGKLAQTIGYGATVLEIRGDFDSAMKLVRLAADRLGIYLVNSINPFRIEGQKTIVWELLQDLEWKPPDWIVLPAGNLGNTSAFGKALREAKDAGWIAKVPRLAAIQAAGANPFYRGFLTAFRERHRVDAETIATAIRIGDPVSHFRAVDAIRYTDGVVEEVSDEQILSAKRQIDRYGIGCEPASAATLAGLHKLREASVIKMKDRVACVLTGHMLKDPEAILRSADAKTTTIDPTIDAVESALR
jgi:threonine synthase